MLMVTGSLLIRRGMSSDMYFSTLRFIPFSDIPFLSATMPMMVAMQLASAVATRSVGENVSPLPLLSSGASVESVLPEGECVAVQRSSPS